MISAKSLEGRQDDLDMGVIMNENKGLRTVAALFMGENSVYGEMEGVICVPQSLALVRIDLDLKKMARPAVVAHPPSRAWGRLRHLAKPAPDEKEHARWAVNLVWKFGGVLVHPEGSKLWDDRKLPRPGHFDRRGGWTLAAPQYWWGHQAQRRSWFYIVGIGAREIEIPFALGDAPKRTGPRGRQKNGKKLRPEISKAERERVPPDLAKWLVDIARRSRVNREDSK